MLGLPVGHPDFRYPVSPNPYSGKILELPQGYVRLDNDTEMHPGAWREQFLSSSGGKIPGAKSQELHVEIGCNGGHVALEWAARNPDNLYLGIDWKFKQIHRGAEKAHSRGITNLIFLRAHAERMGHVFGPGEIDHLYLFFPDPWPKRAHWKNRFLNANRLRALAPLLRPGGKFHIKTDHEGYFDWMENAVEAVSETWRVTERTRDLHAGHLCPTQLEIPEVTLFERVFIRDGIRIKKMVLERA